MIIEERDYRVKTGKLAHFTGLYEQHGLPIQIELLGKFLGYFTAESGELNHVIALWGYESLDDRQARRDRMMADPRWPARGAADTLPAPDVLLATALTTRGRHGWQYRQHFFLMARGSRCTSKVRGRTCSW